MSADARPNRQGDRQAAAVARSLRLADAAAERADWADAVAWVDILDACDYPVPDEYRARREVWSRALADSTTT